MAVPGGEGRGGHAHKELQQFIMALSAAFDVLLDDGTDKKTVHLDRSYRGTTCNPWYQDKPAELFFRVSVLGFGF